MLCRWSLLYSFLFLAFGMSIYFVARSASQCVGSRCRIDASCGCRRDSLGIGSWGRPGDDCKAAVEAWGRRAPGAPLQAATPAQSRSHRYFSTLVNCGRRCVSNIFGDAKLPCPPGRQIVPVVELFSVLHECSRGRGKRGQLL